MTELADQLTRMGQQLLQIEHTLCQQPNLIGILAAYHTCLHDPLAQLALILDSLTPWPATMPDEAASGPESTALFRMLEQVSSTQRAPIDPLAFPGVSSPLSAQQAVSASAKPIPATTRRGTATPFHRVQTIGRKSIPAPGLAVPDSFEVSEPVSAGSGLNPTQEARSPETARLRLTRGQTNLTGILQANIDQRDVTPGNLPLSPVTDHPIASQADTSISLTDIDNEAAPAVPHQALPPDLSTQPSSTASTEMAGPSEMPGAISGPKNHLSRRDLDDPLSAMPFDQSSGSGNDNESSIDGGVFSSQPRTLMPQDLIWRGDPAGWEAETVTDQLGQMQLDRLIETLIDRLERAYLRTYGTSGG